jgi:hypothetical protein
MDDPRVQTSNDGVIQHGPEFFADRAGTLLLIQHLRQEQRRIADELQRVNDRLAGTADPADMPHIDLHQTARELQLLSERVEQLINLQESRHSAVLTPPSSADATNS